MSNDNLYEKHIKGMNRVVPTPTPDEDEEGIGDLNGRFSALRPTNKPIPRLHVVKDGVVFTYQYVNLLSGAYKPTDSGQRFIIDFAHPNGLVRITVDGRNLWRCFDYCTLHRWPYLRADDRDFAQGKEPTITFIAIDEIKEKQ